MLDSAVKHESFTPDSGLDQVRVLADQTHASPVLSLYIACAVNALGPHLTHHRVKTVLEIGPASALFAISLRMLYGCRFVLVDLPEVLNQGFATISYYVPDAEIVLPNEVEDGGAEVWQKDFVLLVPEQIDLIPSGSLDCAINMSSFQEMTYPLIAKYFQLIRRWLREAGLFYCLNEARFSRHPEGKAIEFERYPSSTIFRISSMRISSTFACSEVTHASTDFILNPA